MNEWTSAAIPVARKIVRRMRKSFMAEEIMPEVVKRVGQPKEPRNFGAVIQALSREGEIRMVGYAFARTSNNSPKILWAKAESTWFR